MKKLFGLMAVATAFNVMADAGNTFTFSLNSSDDKMYVCNVGIRHVNGLANNGDLITSGAPLKTHDYVAVNYTSLSSDMVSGSATSTAFQATAAYQDFVTVNSLSLFKNKINSLSLNLASEQYGVEFYVDVCYRGNQINFGAGSIPTDFELTYNEITFTTANAAYITNSGLQVRTVTDCDTQLSGARTGATPDIDVVATASAILANLATPDSTFQSNSGSYTSVPGSGTAVNFISSGNVPLKGPVSVYDTPSFCRTRYYVKENATTERNWKGTSGSFTAKTEVLNLL